MTSGPQRLDERRGDPCPPSTTWQVSDPTSGSLRRCTSSISLHRTASTRRGMSSSPTTPRPGAALRAPAMPRSPVPADMATAPHRPPRPPPRLAPRPRPRLQRPELRPRPPRQRWQLRPRPHHRQPNGHRPPSSLTRRQSRHPRRQDRQPPEATPSSPSPLRWPGTAPRATLRRPDRRTAPRR